MPGDLQAWLEADACDGFNLLWPHYPKPLEDFVTLVVPELQSRGSYKTAYSAGSLRHKIFGKGDRLPRTHSAHAFRIGTTLQGAAE